MNYIKIKIKPPFYIEEIAKEYNITEDELRNFHNQHCGLSELMPRYFPKYIEYVYLPTLVFENRQKQLLPSKIISFPQKKISLKYGTIIRYINVENLQVHYKIDVDYLSKNQIKINRHKVFVNNNEISLVVEQMMEKAQEALFPMVCNLKPTGELFQIANYEEIQNRWKNVINPELNRYYKQELAEKIIIKLDLFYQNIRMKTSILNQNQFFNFFCLPIYGNYAHIKTNEISIYFPSIKRVAIYETEFILDREYSKSRKIIIKVKGIEIETALNINEKKGIIELKYKLNADDFTIYSIAGFVNTFSKNKINTIEFQLFEQKK